jgi:hypothetical protein
MIIPRLSPFQVWKWISVLWLVVAGGIAVLNWPGEDYAKHIYFGEVAPDYWRDQHPECRDRYAFWSDGQRMDPSEFRTDGYLVNPDGGRRVDPNTLLHRDTKTPEQQARDNWADDIRAKVWTCEKPLWLASAQAAAIRDAQSGYIALAILPPLILLAIGAALIAIWRRFMKVHWQKLLTAHWLKLPQHIRTGLLRLYGVVAVPWIVWFGYHLLATPSLPYSTYHDRWLHALWLLLSVPIGAPIVAIAVLWVIAGFRGQAAQQK